ncbi:hypothetical protein COBT_001074 [Conglomerata obtusa]
MNHKERRIKREQKIKQSNERRIRNELAKIGKDIDIDYNKENDDVKYKGAENAIKKIVVRQKPNFNRRKQPIMKTRLHNIINKISK